MNVVTKTNETNTENKFLKKARCRCNGKIIKCIYLFPSVLHFTLHIYFRTGQEFAKCDQIATNKNVGTFISLPISVFLSLHRFEMFITSTSSISDLIVVSIYSIYSC